MIAGIRVAGAGLLDERNTGLELLVVSCLVRDGGI